MNDAVKPVQLLAKTCHPGGARRILQANFLDTLIGLRGAGPGLQPVAGHTTTAVRLAPRFR